MSRARPPRLAVWWARRALRREDAERLLADLDDEYVEYQRPERGPIRANAWYLAQVVSSARVLRRRARSRPQAGARLGDAAVRRWGIDGVRQDIRHALLQLRSSPAFTVAAGLTLALGIGATTAIFSVVRAVILDALPYDAPERIYRAWAHTDDGDITDFSFRVAEYRALRNRTEALEAVGAEFPVSLTVQTRGREAQQIQGRMITADFFRVFGAGPSQGAMFTAEEIAAGDRPLAIVTHGFWRRELGSDPAAIGGTIELNGNPFTVVGVLPESYEHVSGADAAVFIPFTIGTSRWIAHWLELYVRVRPGVSAARAQEEVNAAIRTVAQADRRSAGWHATVETLHEMVSGDVKPAMWATFAMVVLVLLIACVNVANLTLARATSRATELSVRRALGASRMRVARQLFVENVVMALTGGSLGVGLAVVGLRALQAVAPESIPRIGEARIDAGVLVFALAVTLATSILFGVAPSLRLSELATARTPALGTGPNRVGRPAGRWAEALVVGEVALTLVLLVGAGLMVRTMERLNREDLGIRRAGAATFRVSVPAVRYPTGVETYGFYRELRSRLLSVPGVEAVGEGSDLPVSGQGAVASVTSPGRVEAGIDEGVTVLQRRAGPGFFSALGTPLLEGREFDARDGPEAELVTIVSASLAATLFPGESAVGRRIGWGGAPPDDAWLTIVGVVADVRYMRPDANGDPQVYQSHAQSAVRDMAIVVRVDGDPASVMASARAVVRDLDPGVPVYRVTTLEGVVGDALAGRRFTMLLFSAFAAVALVLTLVGIYGMLTFVTSHRRREIGLRMALGARAADVWGLVLTRGLRPVAVGAGLGLAGAMVGGRLVRSLLFGVGTTDPGTLVATVLLLFTAGTLACWIPARRASRTDPMVVLREESGAR